MIPIRCTACGEAAQIDEAWLGQLVECPHCGEATPAAAPPPPATAPPAVPAPSRTGRFSDESEAPPSIAAQEAPQPQPKPAAPGPAPKRPPLTRAERLAIRRRRQLIIACGGGAILIIALFALLSLRS